MWIPALPDSLLKAFEDKKNGLQHKKRLHVERVG